MQEAQKKEIQKLLEEYLGQYESQSRGAATIEGCSEATLIQMLKGRWDNISDKMWRSVGKQVGYKQDLLVETRLFKTCTSHFTLAQNEGKTFALVGKSATGKTFAAKWYWNQMKGKNVYYLGCAQYWTQKYFLQQLLRQMGKNAGGLKIEEMMDLLLTEIRRQEKPLIIIDEVDKLKDPVLMSFITLYNDLDTLCGFVWLSTDAIEKRFEKNLNKQVIGYEELKTRVTTFTCLPAITRREYIDLCESRGITSEEEINRAFNESKGSIRRIDRINLVKRAESIAPQPA